MLQSGFLGDPKAHSLTLRGNEVGFVMGTCTISWTFLRLPARRQKDWQQSKI